MRLGWREVACKQSTPPRTPARASRFVSRTGLRDARNREGRTGAQRTDASRQRPPVEQKRKQNSELTRSSQTAMSGARVLQSRCGAVVTRPASRRTVTCASDRMSEMRREAHFSRRFLLRHELRASLTSSRFALRAWHKLRRVLICDEPTCYSRARVALSLRASRCVLLPARRRCWSQHVNTGSEVPDRNLVIIVPCHVGCAPNK